MDLTSLRVVDLKEELGKRGLSCKGKKAELLARLKEAVAEEEREGKAEEPEETALSNDSKKEVAGKVEPEAVPKEDIPVEVSTTESVAEKAGNAEPEAVPNEDTPAEVGPTAAGETAEKQEGSPTMEDKEEGAVVGGVETNNEAGKSEAKTDKGSEQTAPSVQGGKRKRGRDGGHAPPAKKQKMNSAGGNQKTVPRVARLPLRPGLHPSLVPRGGAAGLVQGRLAAHTMPMPPAMGMGMITRGLHPVMNAAVRGGMVGRGGLVRQHVPVMGRQIPGRGLANQQVTPMRTLGMAQQGGMAVRGGARAGFVPRGVPTPTSQMLGVPSAGAQMLRGRGGQAVRGLRIGQVAGGRVPFAGAQARGGMQTFAGRGAATMARGGAVNMRGGRAAPHGGRQQAVAPSGVAFPKSVHAVNPWTNNRAL